MVLKLVYLVGKRNGAGVGYLDSQVEARASFDAGYRTILCACCGVGVWSRAVIILPEIPCLRDARSVLSEVEGVCSQCDRPGDLVPYGLVFLVDP